MSATAGGGAVMMFASPYSSNWTSVLSPYEMPIRSGSRAKSCAGNDFVVVRNRELLVPDKTCERSERRRYDGLVKDPVESQAKAGCRKSRRPPENPHKRISLSRFRFSIFGLQFLRGEK
jgi:hypothetical protein